MAMATSFWKDQLIRGEGCSLKDWCIQNFPKCSTFFAPIYLLSSDFMQKNQFLNTFLSLHFLNDALTIAPWLLNAFEAVFLHHTKGLFPLSWVIQSLCCLSVCNCPTKYRVHLLLGTSQTFVDLFCFERRNAQEEATEKLLILGKFCSLTLTELATVKLHADNP